MSIELKLAKDTLALAEATVLTVAVTNNSNRDVLLDNRYLFGGTESPYYFKLFMVSPEGEEWEYKGGRRIHTSYLSTDKLYFYLPPQQRVEEQVRLWATTFVPKEYRQALEKLTPGTYKLFAVYQIPVQTGISEEEFYSDTVEFEYLPLDPSDWNSMRALKEMDALSESFLGMFGSEEEASLRQIINTNTPYSEAAHYLLLEMILAHLDKNAYDDFVNTKTQFDSIYPDSPFEPTLLKLQRSEAKRLANRASQADSITTLLENIYPAGISVLRWQNKIELVMAKDVDDRRRER